MRHRREMLPPTSLIAVPVAALGRNRIKACIGVRIVPMPSCELPRSFGSLEYREDACKPLYYFAGGAFSPSGGR